MRSGPRRVGRRALTGERERLTAKQAELREQVVEAVELADGLTAELEALSGKLAETRAARDALCSASCLRACSSVRSLPGNGSAPGCARRR